MWSWASELSGLINPISISSADSFKSLPMTGSKTCRNSYIANLSRTEIKRYGFNYDFKGDEDDLTLRKLRTEASSHRPRSFATSDSKSDSSRTTTGSSAIPSFATGRISFPAASVAAEARVRRWPVIVLVRESFQWQKLKGTKIMLQMIRRGGVEGVGSCESFGVFPPKSFLPRVGDRG